MTSSAHQLEKTIAGEVTLADYPGKTLKKWREIFGINQIQLSKKIGISQSVISDYEHGRRGNPGIKIIKRYINGLIQHDKESGENVVKKLKSKKSKAIIDIQEYLQPVSARKFLEAIGGELITGKIINKKNINGHTIIDSLQAILEMTEKEFSEIYGTNTQRVLIFSKVNLGRSPMVAVKVTKPKPNLIVLHGLEANKVDKLAIHIADSIGVPLAVSNIKSTQELIESLKTKLT